MRIGRVRVGLITPEISRASTKVQLLHAARHSSFSCTCEQHNHYEGGQCQLPSYSPRIVHCAVFSGVLLLDETFHENGRQLWFLRGMRSFRPRIRDQVESMAKSKYRPSAPFSGHHLQLMDLSVLVEN